MSSRRARKAPLPAIDEALVAPKSQSEDANHPQTEEDLVLRRGRSRSAEINAPSSKPASHASSVAPLTTRRGAKKRAISETTEEPAPIPKRSKLVVSSASSQASIASNGSSADEGEDHAADRNEFRQPIDEPSSKKGSKKSGGKKKDTARKIDVVAAKTQKVVDVSFEYGEGPNMNKRIHSIRTFAHPAGHTYGLSKQPQDGGWHHDKVLSQTTYCDIQSKATIRFFLVGRVTSKYFALRNGATPQRVSVNIDFVSPDDKAAANTLIAKHSKNTSDEYLDTQISCFVEEDRYGERIPFSAYYDATSAFTPPDSSSVLDPADDDCLKPGDIVIAESALTRYKKKEEISKSSPSKSKSPSKGLPVTREVVVAQFHLINLYRLKEDDVSEAPAEISTAQASPSKWKL